MSRRSRVAVGTCVSAVVGAGESAGAIAGASAAARNASTSFQKARNCSNTENAGRRRLSMIASGSSGLLDLRFVDIEIQGVGPHIRGAAENDEVVSLRQDAGVGCELEQLHPARRPQLADVFGVEALQTEHAAIQQRGDCVDAADDA